MKNWAWLGFALSACTSSSPSNLRLSLQGLYTKQGETVVPTAKVAFSTLRLVVDQPRDRQSQVSGDAPEVLTVIPDSSLVFEADVKPRGDAALYLVGGDVGADGRLNRVVYFGGAFTKLTSGETSEVEIPFVPAGSIVLNPTIPPAVLQRIQGQDVSAPQCAIRFQLTGDALPFPYDGEVSALSDGSQMDDLVTKLSSVGFPLPAGNYTFLGNLNCNGFELSAAGLPQTFNVAQSAQVVLSIQAVDVLSGPSGPTGGTGPGGAPQILPDAPLHLSVTTGDGTGPQNNLINELGPTNLSIQVQRPDGSVCQGVECFRKVTVTFAQVVTDMNPGNGLSVGQVLHPDHPLYSGTITIGAGPGQTYGALLLDGEGIGNYALNQSDGPKTYLAIVTDDDDPRIRGYHLFSMSSASSCTDGALVAPVVYVDQYNVAFVGIDQEAAPVFVGLMTGAGAQRQCVPNPVWSGPSGTTSAGLAIERITSKAGILAHKPVTNPFSDNVAFNANNFQLFTLSLVHLSSNGWQRTFYDAFIADANLVTTGSSFPIPLKTYTYLFTTPVPSPSDFANFIGQGTLTIVQR